ncbi:hypothetical protein C8J57DRAFT_1458267 [Mycena rebaudengoi]|nr:hypothetical protein C8J57DRAFT_1458267 [Mycena rebaudengoi]
MRALSPAQSAQATTLTRRSTTTPRGSSPLHLATRPRTNAYQLLTTTPYTRGHRHSTSSSTLALDARLTRRALDTSVARRARTARPARRTPRSTRATPMCSAVCAHAAFCGRRLGAASRRRDVRTRGVAVWLYLARAGSRTPDALRPPPFAHTSPLTLTTNSISTEKSARQHVKARKGVPQGKSDSVPPTPTFFEAHSALARTSARPRSGRTPPRVDSSTRGESSDSARGLVSTRTDAACSHRVQSAGALAREERLPDPPRVTCAQSPGLRARSTRCVPHPRAASLWLARWHAACGVFGLARSKPRPRRLHASCAQLAPSRVARAAVCTRACRAAPSPLARIDSY